ncbi:MAG: 4Fe-4S dicluster domain-containing protein [Cellulomonas sp.]|nr:4Fe-4S dicluster domain-containing protein [Cellulomonas sp.]
MTATQQPADARPTDRGPVPASVPARLAATAFVTDEGHPHIVIDQQVARATGAAAVLVPICPAHVYSLAPDGTLAAEYAACLECGTCLAVAPAGSLVWHYPRGGQGVAYREG